MGRTRIWIYSTSIVFALALCVAHAHAQDVSRLDLSVNYVATVANAMPGNCGCFVMNGGGTEDAYFIRRNLAVVADVSVVHSGSANGGAPLGLMTYLFGGRYAMHTHSRFTPYVQALGGSVHGFDSIFPGVTGSTANSGAFTFGGGLEMRHSKRIGFRLIEADYLRTYLPNNVNGTQNNLRLGAGVILHIK